MIQHMLAKRRLFGGFHRNIHVCRTHASLPAVPGHHKQTDSSIKPDHSQQIEVIFLLSNAYAHMPAGLDPVFSASFYAPYEAAADTILKLLESLRTQMSPEVLSLLFRLKSGSSIRGKLRRKGLPETADSACAALHDVAGLRAVLASREAVYRFANLILASSALILDDVHDYIAAPKPSGYRSLHLIVRIPVFLSGQRYLVPAEIQLRTAAMDVWACAEHRLIYKPC